MMQSYIITYTIHEQIRNVSVPFLQEIVLRPTDMPTEPVIIHKDASFQKMYEWISTRKKFMPGLHCTKTVPDADLKPTIIAESISGDREVWVEHGRYRFTISYTYEQKEISLKQLLELPADSALRYIKERWN